jgi:hypothetical protein
MSHLKVMVLEHEREAIECRAVVSGHHRWYRRLGQRANSGVEEWWGLRVRAAGDPEGKRQTVVVELKVRAGGGGAWRATRRSDNGGWYGILLARGVENVDM